MATAHPELEPHVSAVRPRFYQDESYLHGFLGTVGDLQKARAFQDVVLEVEDRRFPCHRLVLSAASPYFRAMFTSDMAESQQETVVLQNPTSAQLVLVFTKTRAICEGFLELWVTYRRQGHFKMSSLKSRTGGFPAIGLFCPRPAPTSGPCLQVTWRKVSRRRLFYSSNELFFMNPHEEKYISCTYKPEDFPRVTDMVVTSDNEIYILQTEELEDENQMFLETQMSLFKYSHAENAWEQAGVSSISKGPGDDFSSDDERLCEVGRIFYYIAIDSKEHRPLLKMRKYNQDMNQWEECSQLKLQGCGYHRDFAALSCSPYLYFLTRWEFHRYDPSQDRWSKLVPPMISDEVCTGVVMGTEIFCTDFHNTQTMAYDTESDCWQKLQGWPKPGNLGITYRPSLFVVENQLHILLKVYDTASQEAPTWSSIDCRVYVYDRSADAWRDLKATLPDKKYHVYGCAPVARVYLPYLKGT
uniref:BTB domain-containing protein n=1 Tax=Branchiostoma floridae TaxID=7739 RepID=C3ZPL7_BRAFL|eukprot:XP_002589503.1 hypothetical protein BRAFLDRAFT_88362 [Branchiostoma floridae]